MKHTWVTGSRFLTSTFCRCCTCEQLAWIESISFSRFVHRVALNAAVLPGAGIEAFPGPPEFVKLKKRSKYLKVNKSYQYVNFQEKLAKIFIIFIDNRVWYHKQLAFKIINRKLLGSGWIRGKGKQNRPYMTHYFIYEYLSKPWYRFPHKGCM